MQLQKGLGMTKVSGSTSLLVPGRHNSSKKEKGKYQDNIVSKCQIQIQISKEHVDRYMKFIMLLEEDLISIKLILERLYE